MKIFTIVILLAITACTYIEERHGASVLTADLDKITVDSTKSDIIKHLGSPSTKSAFGKDTWYYISNQTERRIFSDNELLDQQVLAISFDHNSDIDNFELYGIKDGRYFDFSERETPTAGHELTILEQLLGNVGRFNAESLQRGSKI